MSRDTSLAKMGFYPLPVGLNNPTEAGGYIDPNGDFKYLDKIADSVVFNSKLPIADLMCGDGIPITYLGKKWDMPTYGNELDPTRYQHARQYFNYDRIMNSDAYRVELPTRSLAYLHNNPPYQPGAQGMERTEVQAIELSHYVAYGGLMTYITYVRHLTLQVLQRLYAQSSSIDAYRMPGQHLGEYTQTVLYCIIDPPNATKPGERAQKMFEFTQTPDNIPLITTIPEGKYQLAPKTKRQFYFTQWTVPQEILTRACAERGPQHDERIKTLLSIDLVEDVIRPPMTPREMQIKQLVVTGLFNGIILETERGLCAVRTTVRESKEVVSRDVIETDEGEMEKVTFQSGHSMTVTLLYADGTIEDISQEDRIEAFVAQHIKAFAEYAARTLKPLYTFDFAGGTPEKKYKDGALYDFLIKMRLNGHRLHPGQMHVAAAAIVASLERGNVIVNAAPGFGKSFVLNSILYTLYQISKIVWSGKQKEQKPALQAFISKYKKMWMKKGQFNMITAPSHLTKMVGDQEDEDQELSKWLREIEQAIPQVYARFVKNAQDLSMFMVHLNEHQEQLHILVTSKEMSKEDEGWTAAYVMKHRFRVTDTGQSVPMLTAHGPEDGQMIIERKKELRVITTGDLNEARWWYQRNGQDAQFLREPKKSDPKPNKGLLGNYNKKGREEIKSEPYRTYPLWQESRKWSAFDPDPGVLLANKSETRDRLEREWAERMLHPVIDEERQAYIKKYKKTRIKSFRMLPFPDLMRDWQIHPNSYMRTGRNKNYRLRLATLIAKRYPGKLYAYVPDELHEAQSSSSNAGDAFRKLAFMAKILIGATGSLFGGKASSLRSILFVFNRSLRYRYPWGKADKKWMQDMGRIESVAIRPVGGETTNSKNSGVKRKREVKEKELPGASPWLLREFVECAITADLPDLGRVMPPLDEIPMGVDMPKDVAGVYSFHAACPEEGSMYAAVLAALRKSDNPMPVLSKHFTALMKYPDMPYQRLEPMDGRVFKGFGTDRIYPKEQAVLDILKTEHEAGRNCALYMGHTGEHGELNVQERYSALIEKYLGYSIYNLKANIPTEKREKILNGKKVDILTTNPMLVQTGLDLLQFPTLIFVQVPFNYYVMAQASKRHWRANQNNPCKTYFMYYNDTVQSKGMILMGRKASADNFLMGRPNGSMAAFLGEKGDGTSLVDSLIRTMNETSLGIEDASALFKRVNHTAEEQWLQGEFDLEPVNENRAKPRIVLPDVFTIQPIITPSPAQNDSAKPAKRKIVSVNLWD